MRQIPTGLYYRKWGNRLSTCSLRGVNDEYTDHRADRRDSYSRAFYGVHDQLVLLGISPTFGG